MLVDLQMPDLDGLAVTRAVKYEFPAIRVLVVTMDSAPGRLLSALHAGADGYVLKGCSKHELIETVRAALYGRPRVQPEVAAFLMQIIASGKETAQTMFSERPNRLECEILELSAQGLPPTAIARKLGLEAAGLTSHIVQLLAKLGIDRLRCRRRLVREGAEAPGDSCTLDRMRQLGS
jgi:DNA-binding NarL/FixJ family response regulator